jgi:hypothetical protein
MAILNQQLEWHNIASTAEIRDAFRGTPVKLLLESGAMLCRFITTESKQKLIRGNETFKSPWWLEWKTASAEIHRWSSAKVSPKDVIRGRMAVTTQFNQNLDSLVQIILSEPVYAWKGIVRHQADTVLRITYIGGAQQLFVPNLSSDGSGLSSPVAYMHCFTAIDSIG